MKVILGGGIGGLSAAYYLRNKFPHELIKLYESSSVVGGWIKSTKLPNGTIFEQGPRTLRPRGEPGYNTLQLVDDLGLSDKIVPIRSSHPAAKIRMIYANEKLHTLPSSLPDIFKTISPFSKPLISYILNDLKAERKTIRNNDESIYSFVERRFGTDIAQYAISPLICGICAGNSKEISVKFLMKNFFEKEQKYGSVVKGVIYDMWKKGFSRPHDVASTLVDIAKNEKWSVYSFEGGMETLTCNLYKKLQDKGVDVMLDSVCNKIDFVNDTAILTVNGHTQQNVTKHVISSLPAPKLSDLIQHQHPDLAKDLREISSVNVAVINLYYKGHLHLDEAFGFLVPPSENLPILGVIYDSCCFPNDTGTVLTVMMGGHWFNELFGSNPTEEYLLNIATDQLRNILRIKTQPDNYKVNILKNCIPQYVVGHSERVHRIEQYIKDHKLPLSICGSSYYGVGVNDVILSAKNAAEEIKL